MAKKHLITYEDTEIIAISEAPNGGLLLTNSLFIIETLDNAKLMLTALGVNVSAIDNYQSYNE